MYQEDGFHRYPRGETASSRPVCNTRYPCHPKGIKERYAATKGRGKGAWQQMNTAVQNRFDGLLVATFQKMEESDERGSKDWEVVLELNCERRVVAEATRQAMQLIVMHRGSLPRCVY